MVTITEFETFLISTGAITLLSYVMYHRNEKNAEKSKLYHRILSSPEKSWKKVGKVKEIIYYPLKSGKGKYAESCKFDQYGIIVDEPGKFPLKDRMFIVYEEKTGKFQSGRQYPKLLLVNLYAIDEDRAKLEVADMPDLLFDLPKLTEDSTNYIDISMWFGEPAKCIDCGPRVAAWLSKYLIGSGSGLRMGIFNPIPHRDVLTGAWEEHSRLYNTMRNEDVGLFSDLASYMVMSESSVADLNERLIKPIKPIQLRPNVVVEGCDEPYAEDGWEWIRIGKDVVIRNFKPCTRCTMTRVDPDTGVPDPKYEPLKTLRTYRKLKDPEKDKLEEHAPAIGIYCGLYRSGTVKLNDDIFVYQSN